MVKIKDTIKGDVLLDRNEAMAFLKELQGHCWDMNPDRISLDESNVSESSVGYRVQIKGIIDKATREYVKTIANKRKLAVKEESDKIIIYKSR
jgi:hypothetical protein